MSFKTFIEDQNIEIEKAKEAEIEENKESEESSEESSDEKLNIDDFMELLDKKD